MSDVTQRYGTFKRILFCTDFSDNAEFAFDFAIDIAERNTDCTLFLLHVIPEVEAQFWKSYIYETDDIDEKAKQDIDNKVAEVYLPRIPHTIHHEFTCRVGKDYMEILDFAQEENVDLIIIGRQGQSSFRKVLFGNVTEKITRHAECPVLVIPLCFQKKTKT
jgi:nucleotide-binding universal stress UspA family protein